MSSLNIDENEDFVDEFELFVSSTTRAEHEQSKLNHYMSEFFLPTIFS